MSIEVDLALPRLEVCHDAFSTKFEIIDRKGCSCVDPAYRHCSQMTLGAVYQKNGQLVAASERSGGKRGDLVHGLDPLFISPETIEKEAVRLPGRSLFLGCFMNHYGHFLVGTLSRFWSLFTENTYDNFVFFPFVHNQGQIKFTAFHDFFFSAVGISQDQIQILREPTSFDEIHIPERLITINDRANIFAADLYQFIAAKCTAPVSHGNPERIFVSRLQPFGRLKNVRAVEEIFEEYDFKIIYPEKLNIKEQITYYGGAKILAGLPGSGLHNSIFSKPGTTVIEVADARSKTSQLHMQKVVDSVTGVRSVFIPFVGQGEAAEVDAQSLKQAVSTLPLLQTEKQVAAASLQWPGILTVHVASLGNITRAKEFYVDKSMTGGRSIEGFSINLRDDAPFTIRYRALNLDGSWSAWASANEFVGTKGLGEPIMGFDVELEDPAQTYFNVALRAVIATPAGIKSVPDGGGNLDEKNRRLIGMGIFLARRYETKLGPFKAIWSR